MKISLTLIAAAFAASPLVAGDNMRDAKRAIDALFIDAGGRNAGKARLKDTPNGILLEIELQGVEPGWHALHLHQTGRCDAPDFKSAGEHFQPREQQHGMKQPRGPHAGDLPNVYVHEDGSARLQLFAGELQLGKGDGALLDTDGAALVVHSKPDDYRSQPSGDAGKRIACARLAAAQ